MKSADMIGFETERLKVTEYAGRRDGKSLWKCKCKCGNICYHTTSELRVLQPQSCGCKQKEIARKLLEDARKKQTHKGGSYLEAYNAKVSKNSTTGIKGVHFYRKTGKWRAQIRYAGKNYHLGLYEKIEDAAQARMDAENYIKENFNSPEKIIQYFRDLKK